MYRKFVSIISALSLVLMYVIPASASESQSSSVNNYHMEITESNGVRTVVCTDESTEYIVINDTLNYTICLIQTDLASGVRTSVGPLSTFVATTNYEVQLASTTIHQDTFCDYEYDIYTGSPNEWSLQRPKDEGSGQYYFMVYENSTNTNELDAFYDAVNALNTKEIEAIAACGVLFVTSAAVGFAAGTASGGLLSAAAIAAVVTATGATGAAAVKLTEMGNCCNNCLRAYLNVYNCTDNMHFD